MGFKEALRLLFPRKKKEETGNDPVPSSAGAREIGLSEIYYRPGYNDMSGEGHENTLRCKEEKWTLRSIDRSPVTFKETETTYAVDAAAVAELESFIVENNICDLSQRENSGLFITDYTPWSFTIVFGKVGSRKTCTFGEYLDYSDRDNELIGELRKRLEALKRPDKKIK